MPQLGLGLGLHKQSTLKDPTKELAKLASFLVIGDKADGDNWTKLEPRTLPNGVKNDDYLQRVSRDVVVQASNIYGADGTGVKPGDTRIVIEHSILVGMLGFGTADNICTKLTTNISTPANGVVSPMNTSTHRIPNEFSIIISVPGIYTLAEAKAIFGGNIIIRYQLATPIDTLNSPIFTNPWTDLSGDADITLQGFNATSASGWKQETNEGKTFVGLQFDGANDVGIGNNPRLDIVGTIDFGIGKVTKVPTLTTRYLLTKAEQSEATMQYGLKITNTGVLSIILNGTDIQLATGLLANTFYAIWVERVSGVLKCFINGVEVFSVANNTSLVSRPNFVLGAMSTNVGGTTWTGFSNAFVGCAVITKTDIPKSRVNFNKMTKKIYGLGA